MSKFLAGLILGVFLSFAATSWAAGVFGTGTLSGWTVNKDGEEVCSDPSVDTVPKKSSATDPDEATSMLNECFVKRPKKSEVGLD